MEQKKKKKIGLGLLSALLCVPFAFGVLAGCGSEGELPDEGAQTPGGDQSGEQGGEEGGEHGGEQGGEEGGEEGGEQGGDPVKPAATEQSKTPDALAVEYTALPETANLDAYAENALDKEIDYLLSLEANNLLYNFRDNAEISVGSGVRYGGWENSLIAGHTMGHYLSAIAQAYANGGTDETQQKRLNSRITLLMRELKKCQAAEDNPETGAKKGFLWGANATNHKKDVEFQFDNVEAGKANIFGEAWVPWYTMHKILAGLIDVYRYNGNETALEIACGLGDWVYNRVSKWSEATRKTVLSIEYGGMNDALYTLYAITGEENYAVAAHKFDEDIPTQGTFASVSMVDRILSEDANYLQGQHANTTIPKVIGILNGYISTKGKTVEGVTGETGRTSVDQYLEVAEKFWTRVVEHHSYVTGGNSNDEHFQRDDSQWSIKSNINCETCNTYNMLKLSRMLFTLTKEKKYLDYYENTYINAILSSQNPETGMTMYFQPMAPGYFKVYSSETNHFWCCTGSGMESMSKLNDSIYYDAGNATYVAMYMSSTYKTDAVSLKMTADLENSDVVTIEVEEGETILRLRRPDWTTAFSLKVNDNTIPVADTDDFASVEVHAGETVTLVLGKNITVHTLPNAKGVYAFKYGPFVLSEQLGTEDMTTTGHGVQVLKPEKAVGETKYATTKNDLADFRDHINDYMTRNSDGTFTLTGIDGGPLTYVIHYKQYTHRYAIYLTFEGEDNTEEPEEPTIEYTEIEAVIQPGRGQYEGGGFLEGEEGSVGSAAGSRAAKADGSFSYWIGVDKSAPESNYIMTAFAKADTGKTIRMSANGEVFYEKTLNYTGADDLYDVFIPIPASVVNAAENKSLGDPVTTNTRVKVTISSAKSGEASAEVHTYFKTVKIDGKLHDETIAYFVDCGDYDPSTLSAGDKFGMLNSVTEQAYGADPLTGRMWGIWDETESDTWRGGAPVEGSVATNSTWAFEYATGDGVSKTDSNRYTKNQFEEGWQTLKLSYKFELADGEYTVKMYFTDPWNCSKNADVSANGVEKLTNVECGKEVSFTVTVTDGVLLLEITNPVSQSANDLCINLCYIEILYA